VDEKTILYLAILSLGTFLGVLAATIYYVAEVRRDLLRPMEDPFQTAIQDQRLVVRDLQRELQMQHQRWTAHLQAMEEQQRMQQTITSELFALRPNNVATPAPTAPNTELQALLAEHHTMLDNLQKIASDNHQALTAQRRAFTRQLKANQAILQRLTALLQNQPPTPAIVSSPQLTEVLAQIDELAKLVQNSVRRPAAPSRQDRLSDIKGIGPVFSGILHEAGIHSFEQLARMTTRELDALLNLPKWRKVDTTDWIEQARQLVAQQRKLEG
jgi:predicted flap endonuclease-1-like 5' DNA nuclease